MAWNVCVVLFTPHIHELLTSTSFSSLFESQRFLFVRCMHGLSQNGYGNGQTETPRREEWLVSCFHSCCRSSADHTSFEAGVNVAASTSGSTTMFDDNFHSGAENNPHSFILDEEQLSISAALFFEDADHFTLGMFNFARWPRIILLAGITK